MRKTTRWRRNPHKILNREPSRSPVCDALDEEVKDHELPCIVDGCQNKVKVTRYKYESAIRCGLPWSECSACIAKAATVIDNRFMDR